MTFLQPFLLLALPLALAPVIIHLLNRLRHRPQPWGAMDFLLAATRSSVDRARLRQFLILLFRVLAVLALVLFLSRPFAGGWIGWAVSAAPDVIFLVVDRSASMEHVSGGGSLSRREEAVRLMAASAREFEERSHLVLVDSATRQPQTLAGLDRLEEHPLVQATDTAADIPSLLQAALSWLLKNQSGNAEIWIGSDLQSSSWDPDPERWSRLMADYAALPQSVRFRLFSMTAPGRRQDLSLRLLGDSRRLRQGSREASFTLETLRSGLDGQEAQGELMLNGVSTPLPVDSSAASHRWNHLVPMGSRSDSGWGCFRLSSDANLRNNTAYFAYGRGGDPRAAVAGQDPLSSSVLRLAASDLSGEEPEEARALAPGQTGWSDCSLLIWQRRLPEDGTALEEFARQGGSVLILPPEEEDASSRALGGIRWGPLESAPTGAAYRVGRWDGLDGPLADTDEGLSLPLDRLEVARRRSLAASGAQGELVPVASFQDGAPLLARMNLDRGSLWFLATLPRLSWSTLAEGDVLVPLVQRLLESGGRRLESSLGMVAGQWPPGAGPEGWEPVSGRQGDDPALHAGVYRNGDRWLSVNRPHEEDGSAFLEEAQFRSLFGELPLSLQEESGGSRRPLEGEIWRLFLFGMLLFLLGEAFLSLPARAGVDPLAARTPA